jgi:hypothetical protein
METTLLTIPGTKLPICGIMLYIAERLLFLHHVHVAKAKEDGGELHLLKVPKEINLLDRTTKIPFSTSGWIIEGKLFEVEPKPFHELVLEKPIEFFYQNFTDPVLKNIISIVNDDVKKDSKKSEEWENAHIACEIDPSRKKILLYKIEK